MLEPESIRTPGTTAVDETWAQRLAILKINQLKIDFANETDLIRLELWLEMFGIDPIVLQQGLTTLEYRRLLQNVLMIFRLSGTPKSIELIAQSLGATTAKVVYKYVLKYDGSVNYSGDYYYDSGGLYAKIAITIEVTGIASDAKDSFTAKMLSVFDLFEPVWIYIDSIDFTDLGFPLTFPILLK